LRYSFSIYVEIRDVVGSGFYKFVRHPIYSGYILSSFGFILMMPRLDFLILAVASIALLFYRAALEEQKLLKNSVLYCEYAKKTPAFFPWYRA
jgi:protein-S-isoprenylcysteine O-methyltransferase Ste14